MTSPSGLSVLWVPHSWVLLELQGVLLSTLFMEVLLLLFHSAWTTAASSPTAITNQNSVPVLLAQAWWRYPALDYLSDVILTWKWSCILQQLI